MCVRMCAHYPVCVQMRARAPASVCVCVGTRVYVSDWSYLYFVNASTTDADIDKFDYRGCDCYCCYYNCYTSAVGIFVKLYTVVIVLLCCFMDVIE